jgi:hypothetical protein
MGGTLVGDLLYRENTPTVASELIDGEVVIINFETGSYYSLAGAGADLWQLVVQGNSLEGIVAVLAAAYDAGHLEMRSAVEALLVELTSEGLAVALPGTDSDDGNGAGSRSRSRSADRPRAPFQAPRLRKYTDMQDLLLLDPIHEVDESGWPQRK